jgi:hypothetical protein
MAFIEEYNELFSVTWHTDDNGDKISVPITNEEQVVVNNKFLLNEIPDKFYNVTIPNMIRISDTSAISNTNEYKISWSTGEVYFHPNLDGATITVSQYYGRGLIKSFARRVLLSSNIDWTSTNLEDLAHEIKLYIDSKNSNLQSQITTNETDIETKYSNHLSSTTAHGSSSLTNQSNVSGTKITDALNTLKINYDNHKNGMTDKHPAQDITYSGTVSGATQVKQAIDNMQTQVNNITASGSIDPEVSQARVDIDNVNHATLKDRLDKWEKKNYFWIETKAVLSGVVTITLTNIVQSYMTLEIYDTTLGVQWFKDIHWTRDNQIITFTSAMPQDITFVIKAY